MESLMKRKEIHLRVIGDNNLCEKHNKLVVKRSGSSMAHMNSIQYMSLGKSIDLSELL